MLLAVVNGVDTDTFSRGRATSVHVYEKDIKGDLTKQNVFKYIMSLSMRIDNIHYSPYYECLPRKEIHKVPVE